MLGFRLIFLGLLGLFKRFPQAVAVSLLPCAVMYPCFIIRDNITIRIFDITMNFWVSFVSLLVITIPALSWAAINWHRIAILEDRIAMFPRFTSWAWVRYMVRFAIVIVGFSTFYIGVFFALDLIFTKVLANQSSAILFSFIVIVMAFVTYTVSIWVCLRLLLCLPALAVDDPASFRQSWRQTVGYTPTILVISLTMLVIIAGASSVLLINLPPRFFGWPAIIWVMIAMCVAVITELYAYIRAQNDVTQVFE